MKKLWGGIFFAGGIVIMGTSGLCSLSYLPNLIHSTELSSDLFLIGVFGGIPFGVGVILVIFGRALILSADAEEGRNRITL